MENLQTNLLQQNFDLAEKILIATDLKVTALDHIRSFFKAGLDFHGTDLWKEALSELDGKIYPKSAISVIREKLEFHKNDEGFQAKEAFLRAENLVVTNCYKTVIEQTKTNFALKRLEESNN